MNGGEIVNYILDILFNRTIELGVGDIVFRALLSVLIGGLIGTERARHGRAAGMRTHILVCIGSALTAMTGIYVNQVYGGGDVLRIAAQVVSGVGFLGAGMIILKNGNVITGLTTAAGVWTTATIGIAIGYGFYSGAVLMAVLFLVAVMLFSKFEKFKRSVEVLYIESDDISNLNKLLEDIRQLVDEDFTVNIIAPKSGKQGNVGIHLVFEKRAIPDVIELKKLNNVLYVIEESNG